MGTVCGLHPPVRCEQHPVNDGEKRSRALPSPLDATVVARLTAAKQRPEIWWPFSAKASTRHMPSLAPSKAGGRLAGFDPLPRAAERDRRAGARCARFRGRYCQHADVRNHRGQGLGRAPASPGSRPVEAGRFVVHGGHDRARVAVKPHRDRDRGGARLRHRPSRHHARLPVSARRHRQGRPATQCPRCRHRQRRAGDRRGASDCIVRFWQATSISPPCAQRATMCGAIAPGQ